MTAQMCDFFEYGGEPYCLVGYTGGNLPSADDFEMRFYPGSTADARGHCVFYSVNQADMLVVQRIEVRGEEIPPIKHQYKATSTDYGTFYDNLNRIIPLTGYVLFSDGWQFRHLYTADEIDWTHPLFEANIDQGHVIDVTDISAEVRRNIAGRDSREIGSMWQGETDEEKLANLQRVWDVTASVLPRRYDVLYMDIWYFNFREYINTMKDKSA
jgi:hypothetical protein